MLNADAVRRAGIEASCPSRRGAVRGILANRWAHVHVDDYDGTWNYVERPDHRISLASPSCWRSWPAGHEPAPADDDEFPFVLTAGSRRASRPTRSSAIPTGARATGRVRCTEPVDALRLGVEDGMRVAVVTKRAGRRGGGGDRRHAARHIILPTATG